MTPHTDQSPEFITKPKLITIILLLMAGATLATVLALPRPPVPISNIRVRNASAVPLENVVINRVSYGNIAAGGVTAYHSWGPAYRYAAVHAAVEGQSMDLVPDDYVEEKPLGSGDFTYVLTIDQNHGPNGIDIRAEAD